MTLVILWLLTVLQVPAPTPPTTVRITAVPTRGPQAGVTCPANATLVQPGQSIQAAFGSVICLKAGVHPVRASITPRTGQTFVGESGAILDGTGWVSTDLDDAIFRSVNNGISNVTIRNLVLQNGPSYGVNAYLTAANWTVENCEIHHFRNGISVGTAGVIRNNVIHHNKGISGDPRPELRGGGIVLNSSMGVQIVNNEVSYNGTEQKFIYGTRNEFNRNVYVADNFYHHNEQNGIWFDGDGAGSIVERNLVEDNGAAGIDLEQTNGVIVRNNTLRRNGAEGIYITISQNTTVMGNILEANRFGITLYLDFASLVPNSPPIGLGWNQDLANNTISGNTVQALTGQYLGMLILRSHGLGGIDPTPYVTNAKANTWLSNTYVAPNTTAGWFQWPTTTTNVNKTWAQWQAIPQDAKSSFTVK